MPDTPKPKFASGNVVTFVNDYGVSFPHRTITEVVLNARTGTPVAYHVTPTDTPWFPLAERNLFIEYQNVN